MIRLFVSDIDDTLYNEQKQVDAENREALKKLQQAGVVLCLASGRNKLEIDEVVQDIGGNYYRICQNGADIFTYDGTCVDSIFFDPHLARDLYQTAKEFNLFHFIGTPTQILIPENNDLAQEYSKKVAIIFEEDPEVEGKIGTSILPSKFVYYGTQEELKPLDQLMHQTFPEKLDSFMSTPYSLDFLPKNVNKGTGVHKLAKHLGVKANEVVTIGDSDNDLSMLDYTPHSFAMSHAKPHIQNRANYVVSSVAEAAEWILDYNQKNA